MAAKKKQKNKKDKISKKKDKKSVKKNPDNKNKMAQKSPSAKHPAEKTKSRLRANKKSVKDNISPKDRQEKKAAKKSSKKDIKKVRKKNTKSQRKSSKKNIKTLVKKNIKKNTSPKVTKSKTQKAIPKKKVVRQRRDLAQGRTKKYIKVKLTKADAAKKSDKKKKNITVKQQKKKIIPTKKVSKVTTETPKKRGRPKKETTAKLTTSLPSSTIQEIKTSKKAKSTKNISNIEEKEITIEKVLEETKEEEFVPQSLRTTESTVFTDQLSDDLSSVYARTSQDLPEPPGKYTLEYVCRASPELLYKFLTDPIELTEWFCDSVNIRNGIYTFVWNGVPQQARLVKQERNRLVRFQWVDKNDGSYFEFSINKNPLTGDVVLYVTDFSEDYELESNKLWWNNQINKLKIILVYNNSDE